VVVLALLGIVVALVAERSEAVTSIVVSISGSDTQSVTPGSSGTFKINITNSLTATKLTVNLTKSAAPTDWTAQLSQTSLQIQALQTVSITLTVGVPSNASADPVGKQITVTATPDYGDTATITTTTRVAQTYGIQTSAATSLKHTIGGSAVTFTVKVNNTGNGQDTVTLTHSGEPSGWTVTHVSSASISALGSTDVVLSVVPPSKTTAGTYQTTLKAASSDGKTNSQTTLVIIIDAQYGLSMSSSDVSKYVTPKVPAYYNLSVTNTGNTDDYAVITITNIPSGWTVLPTSNPVSLGPNQTKTFQILVNAPQSAFAGTQFQIKIQASSNGNSSIVREMSINAVVNQVYDPVVTPIQNTKVVSPGSSVTFKINVTNNGNGNDTIDLSVSGVPTGQGWVFNFNPTSVTLTPGATKTVDLQFSIGSHAAYGDNQVTVRGTSHGTVKVGTTTVVVSVSQFYNLALVPDGAATKRADPGGTVTFNFSVTNTGNGPDDITFSLVGLPTGWVSYFSKATVYNLPANGTQSTMLTIELPSTARADTYKFDVKATSVGNSTVSRTVKDVTVIINQLYSVDISSDVAYIKAAPVAGAGLNITIGNPGSGTDNITVTVTGMYATWVSFNRSTVRLGAGATGDVRATVVPPASTAVGSLSLTFRATSKGKTTVFKEMTITLEVLQVYTPQLTAVEATVHKKPGESASFSLQLKNAGNGADTFKVNFTKNPRTLASTSLASPFVSLSQSGTRTFTVTVSLPADELSADLVFIILATSMNSSTAMSQVTLIVSVDPIYGLDMFTYSTEASAEPTDKAMLEMRLDNQGNALDAYSLKATGLYYKWVSFDSNPLSVGPGKEGILNVTVTLPDDDVITLGTYYINITATSTHDATKTMTIEIAITVKHKEDVDLTITDSIRSRSTDPSGSVTYKVTVKNEGLKQHTVNIALTGDNTDWATLTKRSFLLAAGASTQVNVTVTVPKGSAPASFNITMTGSLDDKPIRSDSVIFMTTINRVAGVKAEFNATAASGKPGKSVTLKVNINNTGNAPDKFALTTDGPGGWVVLSPSSVTLAAGANVNVTVTITAPLEPLTRAGAVVINLTATSKANASVSSKSKLTYTVEQVYGIVAKVSPMARSVDPGGAAVFNVTITNKGNGLDNFTFTIGGARKAWGKMAKTQLGLDAGKDGVIAFTVRIPSNQPVETATLWVLISSAGDTAVTANITTQTTILPFFGVDILAIQDTKAAFPGRSVFYSVTVKNTGNSDDVFDFDITGTNANWVTGIDPITVEPGRTVNIDVNVTPPSDAKNGQYTFTINCSSETQGDAFDILVLKATINVFHGLTASLNKTSVESRPNATEHVLVSVKNTGNVNDTFDVRALGTYASWVTLANATLNTVPGASGVCTATVRVPLNITSGDYVIKFEAKSRAGLNVTEVEYTVRITLSYGSLMTAARTATPAAPNTTITPGATIKNTGNTVDTFDLVVSKLPSDLWTYVLPFADVRIQPGASVTFNISINVPNGLRAGTYQVILKATSRSSPAPAPASTVPFNVTIAFAVSATGPDLTTTIAPNTYKVVQFTVKNDGLGRDMFTLKAEEPNSAWIELAATAFSLEPGQTAIVDAKVTVPSGALAATYTLKVRATSLGDRTVSALADIRVKVSQTYGVSITPSMVQLTGAGSSTTLTTFTVSNLGNGDDTFTLNVRLPTGSKLEATFNATVLNLKAKANTTVRLTIKASDKVLAGSYDVFVDLMSAGSTSATAIAEVLYELPTVHSPSVLTAAGQTTLAIDGVLGAAAQFPVEVLNKGNAADTFSLFINSTNADLVNWFAFEKPEVTLSPGESTVVQVTATVPNNAVAGAYRFEVVAKTTKGDARKALSVTLTVLAYHDVYLTSDVNSVTINPKAGQDAKFELTVNNIGNIREVVTLDVQGPTAWPDPELSPESVTVDPFSTATITMTYRGVLIPSTAVESNSIAVKAIYAEESPTLDLLVTVQKPKIDISPSDITFSNPTPKVGDDVTVTVRVRNTGVVPASGLTVALLVNGMERTAITGVSVAPGGDQTVSLVWKVEEDAGSTPVVKVRVKEVDLTVSAGASPSIKAAAGGVLSAITGLPFAYTLVIGLVIGLIIGILLLVGSRRRAKARVEAARAAGVAEGMSMAGEGKRAPAKPAPPSPEEGEEGEGEEGAEEEGGAAGGKPEAEPEEEAAAGPAVTVQCPRCKTINKVTTTERPYEFRCKQCDALLRLSK
jgi:uncharacterized membrane protein